MKAGLDINWQRPEANDVALSMVLQSILRFYKWLGQRGWLEKSAIQHQQQVIEQIYKQDVEWSEQEWPWKHKEGVAKDRLISLSDPEMRHGRKSDKQRINGYKKVLAADVDSGIILAATVIPANQPDSRGLDKLSEQENWTAENVAKLFIDLAFENSHLTQELIVKNPESVRMKPRRMKTTKNYNKTDFEFDFDNEEVTCPAGRKALLVLSDALVRYSKQECQDCTQKGNCLSEKAKRGKVISLHKHEKFQHELKKRMESEPGREKNRKRTVIEHRLSHHTAKQGHRFRYRGIRKNEFDTRRVAVVNNLHVLLKSEICLGISA